jgi:hypothetical protein
MAESEPLAIPHVARVLLPVNINGEGSLTVAVVVVVQP